MLRQNLHSGLLPGHHPVFPSLIPTPTYSPVSTGPWGPPCLGCCQGPEHISPAAHRTQDSLGRLGSLGLGIRQDTGGISGEQVRVGGVTITLGQLRRRQTGPEWIQCPHEPVSSRASTLDTVFQPLAFGQGVLEAGVPTLRKLRCRHTVRLTGSGHAPGSMRHLGCIYCTQPVPVKSTRAGKRATAHPFCPRARDTSTVNLERVRKGRGTTERYLLGRPGAQQQELRGGYTWSDSTETVCDLGKSRP